MGKIGRKISHGFKHSFGKKTGQNIVKIAKKSGHVIDLAERKIVNSIDSAAPLIALGADAFIPGSGEGILQANDGIQQLHKSGRELSRLVPKLGANGSKEEKNNQAVAFGEGIDKVKEDFNRSKALLRNVASSK